MTYLALARKWRPRDFASLVGQPHVVNALSRALDTGRLHHAYLLSGTRGVGKTTLARIFAKALNCLEGVSSQPCGACRSCVEIDAGRFVDYVEMDAASNRGVEEMTQLLEQAAYAPSIGRFKVYTIDEVHMLTNHAFNAMLKTLEEPPPYVKFVLATTDPQKIPVTVVSRCLQFNLRQMSVADIQKRLAEVLTAEAVAAESAALHGLALAARGSMRDALSLTDQAIAASSEGLTLDTVRQMLGTIDQTYLLRLLQAVADNDTAAAFGVVDELTGRSIALPGVLTELGRSLMRLAVLQRLPNLQTVVSAQRSGSTDISANDLAAHLPGGLVDELDAESLSALLRLAQRFTPDEVQLYYTIVVHACAEMSLAPDDYAGFIMALLRLMQFAPHSTTSVPFLPVQQPSFTPTAGLSSVASSSVASSPLTSPVSATPALTTTTPERLDPEAPQLVSAPVSVSSDAVDLPFDSRSWPLWVTRLKVTGIAKQLAEQSEFLGMNEDRLLLQVAAKPLTQPTVVDKLAAALTQALKRPVRLDVSVGQVSQTAHVESQQRSLTQQAEAQAVLLADPTVKLVIDTFDAQLMPESITVDVSNASFSSPSKENDHV